MIDVIAQALHVKAVSNALIDKVLSFLVSGSRLLFRESTERFTVRAKNPKDQESCIQTDNDQKHCVFSFCGVSFHYEYTGVNDLTEEDVEEAKVVS